MFQFMGYQLLYPQQAFPQALFHNGLSQEVNFQPYYGYFQKPAENFEAYVFQNTLNTLNVSDFSHQTGGNEEISSQRNQTITLFHNKLMIKEKKLGIIQNGTQNMQYRQDVNKQKFGRNIVSNIFHLMIKFIKSQKKLRKLMQKVLQANSMQLKINEFYSILKKKMSKLTAYATSQQMKEFQTGKSSDQFVNSKNKKEEEFAKIFRILGKLYLEKYHIPYAYNSKKIKIQSKKLHKRAIRKIYEL